MSNTPDGSISCFDIAKRGHVVAKLANMRKAQKFVVYPVKTGETTITVQSDKSIGRFDSRTGKGVLNTKGQYFHNLAMGRPFEFPAEFVLECLKIAGIVRPMGESTTEIVVEAKEEA